MAASVSANRVTSAIARSQRRRRQPPSVDDAGKLAEAPGGHDRGRGPCPGLVVIGAVVLMVMMSGPVSIVLMRVPALVHGQRVRILEHGAVQRREPGGAHTSPHDAFARISSSSIARLPRASRKPSSGNPASTSAPRIMSPEAPEKQSK